MKQADDTEFEAKFYPVEKDKYREKLKAVGAKLITPERKMKRALVRKLFNPQFSVDYIRVRDEGDVIRLSAKTHAREGGDLSDQKEIDVIVSDYDKTVKIIEAMGLKFTSYHETLRETWELDGAEITIDTWPGLLTYSEVEASSEQHVKEVAEKLGLNWEKKIITSVTEIYMRVYGLTPEQTDRRTDNCTFENNPFAELSADNSWAYDN